MTDEEHVLVREAENEENLYIFISHLNEIQALLGAYIYKWPPFRISDHNINVVGARETF